MTADERLAKLFEKKNVIFSIEVLESAHVLVTITKGNNTVGGTYESIDDGINDCINKLDILDRKHLKIINGSKK